MGADTVTVAAHSVSEEDLTGRHLVVKFADSRLEERVPTAVIKIDTPHVKGRVEAVVFKNPA